MLGWIEARGTPREIGRTLGQAGREAVGRLLRPHPLWGFVTAPGQAATVARMAEAVRALFPTVWEEVEGLAEGLGLPVDEVFAWNCRGDLLAEAPEGCTTVMLPGPVPQIGHNEDGFPFLRGQCFIARLRPDAAPGILSFCYPGSIPGHSFAATGTGLAQGVNNLRFLGVTPQVPRMVLGRAVLAAGSLEAALGILRAAPASGGFHFALAEAAGGRLVSVEFGGGAVSVAEVTEPMAHANHALHLAAAQRITRSSADRQARAGAMLAEGADALAILADAKGPGLPIRREAADDPDEENTLATALFTLDGQGVGWQVHDGPGGPVYQGRIGPGN